MTLPLLGPMTLGGFAHPWFFLFLLIVAGVAGLYVIAQFARQKRILRFANMELLESVAPKRPNRWRHLPAILLVASLLLLTVAVKVYVCQPEAVICRGAFSSICGLNTLAPVTLALSVKR